MTQSNLTDPADRHTAAVVQAAFADVHMTQAVAAAPEQEASRRPAAAHRGRRWLAAAASAAATAVAITVGVSVIGGAGATAWAAVPATPTSNDVADAVAQCAEPFTTSPARGTAAQEIVTVKESNLRVLDIRGAGAIAIFSEGEASYVCTLAQVDGRWQFAGSTGNDEASPSGSGVTGTMSTTLADGSAFTSLHGYADADTVKVTVTLASGLEAEASLGVTESGQQFAVWFPVAIGDLAGATITTTDADGRSTQVPGPDGSRGDGVQADAR